MPTNDTIAKVYLDLLFQGKKNKIVNILETVKAGTTCKVLMNTKLLLQISLHLLGTRRRVALVNIREPLLEELNQHQQAW